MADTQDDCEVKMPSGAGGKVDHDQVMALIATAQNDASALPKAVQAVRTFLTEDKAQAGGLMRTNEFFPFLMDGLRSPLDNKNLLLDVLWILTAILEDGNASSLSKLNDPNVVILLLPILMTNEIPVLEQATLALELVAKHFEPLLKRAPTLNCVFTALEGILKRETSKPTDQVLLNISRFVYNLSFESIKTGGFDPNKLSSKLAENLLPLVSLLRDSEIHSVRDEMLKCLSYITTATKNVDLFVASGLGPKLTAYLKYSEEFIMGTRVALGTIEYGKGCLKSWRKFLKAVENTDDLKHFWKCLRREEYGGRPNHAMCDLIRRLGMDVYQDDKEQSNIGSILKSGLAHGLATSLQKDCKEEFQLLAVSALGVICYGRPEDLRQKVFVEEMGITPKLLSKYLNSKDEGGAAAGAATLIALLTDKMPEKRDEAISVGVLKTLLETLEKADGSYYVKKFERVIPGKKNLCYIRGQREIENVDIIYSATKGLEYLLEVRPNPPLNTVKKVPVSLKTLLAKIGGRSAKKLMSSIIECLKQFIGYGNEGIDLIMETPELADEIAKFLDIEHSGIPAMQMKALELLLLICENGNENHHQAIVKLGILKKFKQLLEAPCSLVEARKATLQLFQFLLDKKLVSSQRSSILKQLQPLIVKEIRKASPETIALARSVNQKLWDYHYLDEEAQDSDDNCVEEMDGPRSGYVTYDDENVEVQKWWYD